VGPGIGLDDVKKRKFLTLPGLELRSLHNLQIKSKVTEKMAILSKFVGNWIQFYNSSINMRLVVNIIYK
jgi:hypothetical protein